MDRSDALFRSAKRITLSANERAEMRAALHSFMQKQPVGSNVAMGAGILSYFFPPRIMPIFGLIAALMLSAGGGAALAAETSLPGDFLYPLKVNVNEAVRANLNFSAAARAAFETELAERRLTEVQRLTAMGKINDTVRNELFTSFRNHLVESTTMAETVTDASTSASLKANIHTMLTAHAAALQEVSASVQDANLGAQIDEILTEVHANAFVHTGSGIHLPGMPPQAAHIMIKVAEKQIEMTEDRIDDADVSAEVTAEAQAHLALALTSLTEAKTALNGGKNAEAFNKAQAAHHHAIEAKITILTGSIFDRDDDDDGDDDDDSGSRSSLSRSSSSSSSVSSVQSSGNSSSRSSRNSSASSLTSSSVVSSSSSSSVLSSSSNSHDNDDDDNNGDDDDDHNLDNLGDEIREDVEQQIQDMQNRMKDRFDFDD